MFVYMQNSDVQIAVFVLYCFRAFVTEFMRLDTLMGAFHFA